MEDRYAFAPQMQDYDALGGNQVWVPYLMLFTQPNSQFPSVTTDAAGIRSTIDTLGSVINIADINDKEELSVIMGGSAVFGVGATADKFTIPSNLNQITKQKWLNFGGRAFNSTQELLLLILQMPKKINKIVVMSGVNNIIISFLSTNPSPFWAPFYDQEIFLKTMETPAFGHLGVRKSFAIFLREFYKFFKGVDSNKSYCDNFEINYSNTLRQFQRDLAALRILGAGMRAPVYFALQPVVTWIEKELSKEEVRIFEILDNLPGSSWMILQNELRSVRNRYFMDLDRICRAEGVPFYNMNLDGEFAKNEWLFVDRVHMNDRGNMLAASTLKRVFNL